MLSSLVAIGIAVWFYCTAPKSGKSHLYWAISGVVVYFLTALLWTLAVTPAVKDAATHSQSSLLVVIVQYAYILVAATAAAILNIVLNLSKSAK